MNNGDPKKAIAIFEYNASLYPDEDYVFENLATAYLKQGNKKLAKKYYQKTLELNPKNEVAKNGLKE